MLNDFAHTVISTGRRLMLAVLCVMMLAPALPASSQHYKMPRGQKHESHRRIDQLQEIWRTALLEADTSTMASLLADDYMAITINGTLQTKEQTLACLASGKMHFSAIELSDRKMRFYGTTALVTSRAQMSGTVGEVNISGIYRYNWVYVRNAQGAWKIVSFEISSVYEPGEHK